MKKDNDKSLFGDCESTECDEYVNDSFLKDFFKSRQLKLFLKQVRHSYLYPFMEVN